MNLYKVVSETDVSNMSDRFILAEDREKAKKKWLELVDKKYHYAVEAKHICARSEMIPTIEPTKELI